MGTKARKPSIYSGPAANHAGPGEGIYEISSEHGGGLISVSNDVERGRLDVQLYNLDPTVRVSVGRDGVRHSTLGVVVHLAPLLHRWHGQEHGDVALGDHIATHAERLVDLLQPMPVRDGLHAVPDQS